MKKINKLGIFETKKFCCIKDNAKRMKIQTTSREIIYSNDTSDKRLLGNM